MAENLDFFPVEDRLVLPAFVRVNHGKQFFVKNHRDGGILAGLGVRVALNGDGNVLFQLKVCILGNQREDAVQPVPEQAFFPLGFGRRGLFAAFDLR